MFTRRHKCIFEKQAEERDKIGLEVYDLTQIYASFIVEKYLLWTLYWHSGQKKQIRRYKTGSKNNNIESTPKQSLWLQIWKEGVGEK